MMSSTEKPPYITKSTSEAKKEGEKIRKEARGQLLLSSTSFFSFLALSTHIFSLLDILYEILAPVCLSSVGEPSYVEGELWVEVVLLSFGRRSSSFRLLLLRRLGGGGSDGGLLDLLDILVVRVHRHDKVRHGGEKRRGGGEGESWREGRKERGELEGLRDFDAVRLRRGVEVKESRIYSWRKTFRIQIKNVYPC